MTVVSGKRCQGKAVVQVAPVMAEEPLTNGLLVAFLLDGESQS